MVEYCINITNKFFQEMNGGFERFGFPSFSHGQNMGWMIPQDVFCQNKEA